MKIFSATDRRAIDIFTIENEPLKSIDLMERAAWRCSGWLSGGFDHSQQFYILVGGGNNGGDGLAIARMLAERNYKVVVFLCNPSDKWSSDAAINLVRLREQAKAEIITIADIEQLPHTRSSDIWIDALFGSGLNRPIEGLVAACIARVNKLRGKKIAIDIPSGLLDEQNCREFRSTIFRADYTLTFQFPYLSFFFAEHEQFVGKWILLNIGLSQQAITHTQTPYYQILKNEARSILRYRNRFAHKGYFGHALLIAGSKGMGGASVLAAKACLRTGVGLLTVHAPQCNYSVLQTAVPEAMCDCDASETHFTSFPDVSKYSVVAIGPGLGTNEESAKAFAQMLDYNEKPMIIDADALNLLAQKSDLFDKLIPGTIITPHPGEFERLCGPSENSYVRLQKARELASHYNIYVVLKGAYTATVTPEGRCYFNSSGNPGMATGGSGDVLTGILAALMAQGYQSEEACLLGVYLHGLSGDISARRASQEALIASDLADNLGAAFRSLLS